VGRDPARGEAALDEVRRESGNPAVELLCADLSSRRSIRELAASIEAKRDALHVLVNAAGTLLPGRRTSVDGIDMTIAVDYLSHFLLTNLLLGILKKSAPSRVVTVTGGPRALRRTLPDPDVLEGKAHIGPIGAAVWAAAARLAFSLELARRMEGTGVTSNAFHPGLVRSNLGRNLPFPLKISYLLVQPFLKDTCASCVHLASSPGVEGISGRYFVGEKPMENVTGGYTHRVGASLWEISGRLADL
jgi:retinol dehydrogenase 12